MKNTVTAILFSAATALTMLVAHAQPLPAGAPAGTTVECKDGSFASPEAKSGACSGHKGIRTWFGKTEMKAGAAAPASEMKAAPSTTSAAPHTTKESKGSKASATDPSSMTPAPGGGAGKVWVNSASKVYHCESDRYYGKTKRGEYMTEAEAKAKGMRAAYKKTCGG